MTLFRNFTIPLWEIFIGNLLMLVTIIFYIAWWTASFRADQDSNNAAGLFIAIVLLAGMASIIVLFLGINGLPHAGKGFSWIYILLGAVIFYIIILEVTKIAFERPVTAELLLIIVWAAIELSAIAVLHGCGRFGMGQALTLAVLVILAVATGLVCYILYYRLDESSRLWTGLIPLLADAGVVTVFLAVMGI